MREILFRGKRLDNGEWVEGQLLEATPSGKTAHLISVNHFIHALIDPKTIGQYTGLTDRNGKRIFEGDIVEGSDFNSEDGYGEIMWDEQTARFAIIGNTNNLFIDFDFYFGNEIEVVGNIHDNPELLESRN